MYAYPFHVYATPLVVQFQLGWHSSHHFHCLVMSAKVVALVPGPCMLVTA